MNYFIFKLLFVIALLQPAIAQESENMPAIIAHRGAAAYAPENTLEAFRKAIAMKAGALEIDVRQSRDSQLVVMHDEDIDRTTNGEGNVSDLTLKELKVFDAGSWFGIEFRDVRIPTLQEVIDVLDSSTTLIIELKESSETSPDIEKRVVDLVKKNRIEHRVILKSFDRGVLTRLRTLAPEISLLYVYVFSIPWVNLTIDQGVSTGDLLDLDVEYLQPHKIFLTKSFIESAHAKGYKVIAWDVKAESTMKEMITLGIDGIETDYPDVLFNILQERQKIQ